MILKRYAKTWANTDTRLHPDYFRHRNLGSDIAIRELGVGGAFNDFLRYLSHVSVAGVQANISELQELMRTKRIDRK